MHSRDVTQDVCVAGGSRPVSTRSCRRPSSSRRGCATASTSPNSLTSCRPISSRSRRSTTRTRRDTRCAEYESSVCQGLRQRLFCLVFFGAQLSHSARLVQSLYVGQCTWWREGGTPGQAVAPVWVPIRTWPGGVAEHPPRQGRSTG